jgi:hypothetical protein
MRTIVAALALGAAMLAPVAGAAGPIERACLNSDRKQVSRALCICIQRAADMTLRGGDQRKAAAFFRDPDRAQKVRMSASDADNAFWDRYKNFGATAEAVCAQG